MKNLLSLRKASQQKCVLLLILVGIFGSVRFCLEKAFCTFETFSSLYDPCEIVCRTIVPPVWEFSTKPCQASVTFQIEFC